MPTRRDLSEQVDAALLARAPVDALRGLVSLVRSAPGGGARAAPVIDGWQAAERRQGPDPMPERPSMPDPMPARPLAQIGRASCRERV